MPCCLDIAGLVNYEGSAWLKANYSNQAVVFLKRGNTRLRSVLCSIRPFSAAPAAFAQAQALGEMATARLPRWLRLGGCRAGLPCWRALLYIGRPGARQRRRTG
jgi:hypothetical protein